MSKTSINSRKNLLNYLRNKLSNKDRYTLEKELTKDPFLEDAMDGFAQLSADELENDLAALQNALENKVKKPKSRRLLPYFKIAAGIAIIIGIGSLIIYLNTSEIAKKELAENIEISKDSDSLNQRMVPVEQARRLLDEMSEEEDSQQIAAAATPKTKQKESKTIIKKVISISEVYENEETMLYDEELVLVEDIVKVSAKDAEVGMIEIEPIARQTTAQPAVVGYSTMSSAPKIELAFTIQGTIVDADTKEPLPGANIISHSNNGTVADVDGNFNLNIVDDTMIQIAYIGYDTKKISLTDIQQNNNTIELEVNNVALNEVVIVNSRINKKQNTKTTAARSEASIDTQLSGRVAGVSVKKSKTSKVKWVEISYHENYEIHCAPVGGLRKFEKYIKKNTRIKPETPKSVSLELVVETFGLLSEIRVTKSSDDTLSEEAIRLVREGPEWEPALINNIAKQEKVTLSITFH